MPSAETGLTQAEPVVETDTSQARLSFRDALNATIEKHQLIANQIAKDSKIAATAISRFRNGQREITTRVLQQILESLPGKAYFYLLHLMASGAELLEQSESPLEDPDFWTVNDFQLKARGPTIRDALSATIDNHSLVVYQLAQGAGISSTAISRFRTGHREITTRVLQQILEALPEEAYVYFLRLMASGIYLLKNPEIDLGKTRQQDYQDFWRTAIRLQLMNYVAQASTEDFEDMLSAFVDARRMANRAHEQPQDEDSPQEDDE